eukprot:4949165-Prymnesium_polylepis.1
MPMGRDASVIVFVLGLVVAACCMSCARTVARLLDAANQREQQYARELKEAALISHAEPNATGASQHKARKKSPKPSREAYKPVRSKDDEP